MSSNDEGGQVEPAQEVKRLKRKKASRACFHCQKAHLTCDDSRPCQRCIKRGLDASCQDGVRKKAKYLLEAENKSQSASPTSQVPLTSAPTQTTSTVTTLSPVVEIAPAQGTVSLADVQPAKNTIFSTDTFGVFGDNILFDYPPLSTYEFDSKAANMEYSMLSNMLGSAGTPGTDYGQSPDTYTFPSPSMAGRQHLVPSRQQTTTPEQASVTSESSWSNIPSANGVTMQTPSPFTHNNNKWSANQPTIVQPRRLSDAIKPNTTSSSSLSRLSNQSQNHVDPHGQRPTPVARRPLTQSQNGCDSIYKAINKPFSYTHGYHLLNTYLRSRFEKEDLLRIARAIVGYRPSFIALTKTLREDDLIFMEVCFQRTLLEYEKFVGYSGTPTIIWRRTGQIELVGKEFCSLTQWSREQLLAKQTFIVELMDDSSVVEYFEKFSAHAFGDTSSVQTTCVLMTPYKRAVPCAFCFTIKRDVFDIPTMIVGNFLPVL